MNVISETTSRFLTKTDFINVGKNASYSAIAVIGAAALTWTICRLGDALVQKISSREEMRYHPIIDSCAIVIASLAGTILSFRVLNAYNITAYAPALPAAKIVQVALLVASAIGLFVKYVHPSKYTPITFAAGCALVHTLSSAIFARVLGAKLVPFSVGAGILLAGLIHARVI